MRCSKNYAIAGFKLYTNYLSGFKYQYICIEAKNSVEKSKGINTVTKDIEKPNIAFLLSLMSARDVRESYGSKNAVITSMTIKTTTTTSEKEKPFIKELQLVIVVLKITVSFERWKREEFKTTELLNFS